MQVTFFSFIMAVFWSSIMILLLYAFRKTDGSIRQFGVSSMIGLYAFCAIRMAISLEFPFTQVVSLRQVYNPVHNLLYRQEYTIGHTNFHLKSLLIPVWLGVAVILLSYFVIHYYHYVKPFSGLKANEDEKTREVLNRVVAGSKREIKVGLVYSDQVDIPIGIGVFKRWIILPNGIYSEDQLYYILRHEYTHFLNRDLALKMLIHVFCCIFWWNPLVYLLRQDLDQMLEIKCDLAVAETMDKSERGDYLKTILAVVKQGRELKAARSPIPMVALLNRKKKTKLEERFTYVLHASAVGKSNRFVKMIPLLVFCVLFFLSYLFIFQSAYDPPPETTVGVTEMDVSGAYIMADEEGQYWMYLRNGEKTPISNLEGMREIFEDQGVKILEEGDTP